MKKLIFTLCGMFFTSVYASQEVKTNIVSDSAELRQKSAQVSPAPSTDPFIKYIKPEQKQAAAVDRHVTPGYLEALAYTDVNSFYFQRCRSMNTPGLTKLFNHLIFSGKKNIKIIITGKESDWSNDELFAAAFCLAHSSSVTKMNVAGFDANTPEAKERFEKLTSPAFSNMHFENGEAVFNYFDLLSMMSSCPYGLEYVAYVMNNKEILTEILETCTKRAKREGKYLEELVEEWNSDEYGALILWSAGIH